MGSIPEHAAAGDEPFLGVDCRTTAGDHPKESTVEVVDLGFGYE
jgi:hypothetical protein